jgi:hypothetical protein
MLESIRNLCVCIINSLLSFNLYCIFGVLLLAVTLHFAQID